ncbi:SDR family NAD(P)-dependent oxidoreductase [Iamia sp. SCSIO 61187]|uniref:oxidoreductase n=1 Tax=Iamia sp. SCSIO 61187 TaxID=2722752 RepID=UPI001C63A805|nr:oxidoreductase [Iamia sp. SCSIO 61187]QYG93846.1 SDR family NAD(P)-dependent oxidoreductase [Iamia sp. SCSIO 61187]
MPWRPDDIGDLTGRVAVVTGATSGLGTVTARELARHGAHVIATARDERRGERALERLRADVPAGSIELRALDLASLASVATFAADVGRDHRRLDVVVNNAGVMAPPRGRTEDGFELQIGTNHLGPFALTGRLLPLLHVAPAARVVTVASLAHTWGTIDLADLTYERRRYLRWPAYGASKLANLLFAFELDRRLRATASPVVSLAAHPGLARTRLGRSGGGPLAWLQSIGVVLARPTHQSARRGAEPQLRAATDPDVPGGAYLGPGGPGEARGPAVIVGCSPAARDPSCAQALWDLSVALTGVDPGLDPAFAPTAGRR